MASVLPQRGIFDSEQISQNDLIQLPTSEEAESIVNSQHRRTAAMPKGGCVCPELLLMATGPHNLFSLFTYQFLGYFLKDRLKHRKVKWINHSVDGQEL